MCLCMHVSVCVYMLIHLCVSVCVSLCLYLLPLLRDDFRQGLQRVRQQLHLPLAVVYPALALLLHVVPRADVDHHLKFWKN